MLKKTYSHKEIEEKLYNKWEENGYFKPEINKDGKPFTIVMPPPNITGQLHLGHAFDGTIQDILTRYKRMLGCAALWLPGEDHASIATEVKLVEKIKEEYNKTKEELGREAFLKEAWEWSDFYRKRIASQFRKLGTSCDWSRERFTMDEGCSQAVKEFFVDLYNKGLIYRGNRIINWCTTCKTTISDAEVEYQQQQGGIYYIIYQIEDDDESIIVATTRPETMLGDTGIAVAPDDERYAHLIGKNAILPLIGRKLPIFSDSYVDKEFGTGCVKVTPCHDPNDFEMGLRHNLEQIRIFDYDGTLNKNASDSYAGLTIMEARKKVLTDLDKQNLLVKMEPYTHNVGTCYRCDTNIQPITSEQWFVDMKPLAAPAIQAVKDETVNFVPKRFEKVYFNWMENIKDWCISRQLWWGHRIPVYYCNDCNEMMVQKEAPKYCSKCKSQNIRQDEDVLDTWFSSGLWPFSTLGWPEKTADLEKFYPNDVLVTGFDIIFLWVARMIMSGYSEMEEQPFSNVLIHGLIRDAQGRKMSKSLGNGVDPLEVIDQYGADVLRITLITGNKMGNDARWNIEKLEANRNFMNKLYNAAKFILMNTYDYTPCEYNDIKSSLSLADEWIIGKLHALIAEINANMEKYEFGIAAEKLYDFAWNVFCDWYIELSKTSLYNKENENNKKSAQFTLKYVFSSILKMLHPFIPFITEELYLELNANKETIMIQKWLSFDENMTFDEAQKDMDIIIEAVRSIRNARSTMNIAPSKRAELYFEGDNIRVREMLKENENYFKALCSAKSILFKKPSSENIISAVFSAGKFLIPLDNLIDKEKERERLLKEKLNIQKELKLAESKLSNAGFMAKAPESVVLAEKEKQKKYTTMLEEVAERLSKLS
jgi:valyl-tRNA synthetase